MDATPTRKIEHQYKMDESILINIPIRKGFGFVEMSAKAEAQSAIEGLNGKDLKGRSLNVKEAVK